MVDLMYCLKNLLFFDIPLLCYYICLRSLIICCFFLEVCIFLLVFLSNFVFSVSPSTVSELDCYEPFAAFVILSPVLLPIKSPLAYAVF